MDAQNLEARNAEWIEITTDTQERERNERTRAEEMAAEREAILGQITDGIVIADRTGTVVFFNAAAQQLYGVSLVGRPIEDYARICNLHTIDGEAFPPDQLPLARAMRHHEIGATAEFIVERPTDGRHIVARGTATPVILEDGTHIASVLIVRDITSEWNLDRQKDEFLSAAAHDLKTPLTTIKGYTQMLLRRAQRMETPEIQGMIEPLERISHTAGRMTKLIDELLDVTRIQMGHPLRLNLSSVDLVQLVDDVVEQHPASAIDHHISVDAQIPSLIGTWDGSRLERVVNNLLSNSIKYSPENREISITVRQEGEAERAVAVLEITDQGVGIPADDLPHIFERFHRGRNVMDDMPGAGVGLAAVKQIVEQHRGTIEAHSEEGRGATFVVRLPLADLSLPQP